MIIEKFRVSLFLKKKRVDKFGKSPIIGRIVVNNSIAEFSLKLSCTPELWNTRERRPQGRSREAIETNAKIERLLLDVHSVFNILKKQKQAFDATTVKDLLQGRIEVQMTLLKLLDLHINGIKERVGIDRAPTTLGTYVYTRRSLEAFIKKKFKTNDIVFGQLSEQFITEYQKFALEDLGYAVDTVRHYLAILKKICRIAYNEGYSTRHYFSRFKLPIQKGCVSKSLTRENFEKLKDLEIPERYPSHILTKDLFLFACYTGTPYADVVSITGENLYTDEQGNLWLKYRRRKNELLARVKLLPEAIALLVKYRDESRKTLFPMQYYRTLNANMKALRIMAGLTQNLSYHLGRHSFASLIALEEGVPIETIRLMLGHSNIKITQLYAHVTPKRLFEEMDKYIEATKDLKLIL